MLQPEKAFGVIATDTQGKAYDGRVGPVYVSSPMTTEAKALIKAVEYATQQEGCSKFFSDCRVLVNIP
ncbi:hypothetical protein LINGRAHAP2_LOCUS25326 [Linum grandiflorum]